MFLSSGKRTLIKYRVEERKRKFQHPYIVQVPQEKTRKVTRYRRVAQTRQVRVPHTTYTNEQKVRQETYDVTLPVAGTRQQQYTVTVPYTENVSQSYIEFVPRQETIKEPYRVQVQVPRQVTRTYRVNVPYSEDVPRQYTVQVPYQKICTATRLVTRRVPFTQVRHLGTRFGMLENRRPAGAVDASRRRLLGLCPRLRNRMPAGLVSTSC